MTALVVRVALLKSTKNFAGSSRVWPSQSVTSLTLQRKLNNPMSELVLEPGQFALPEAIQPVSAPAEDADNDEKATMLPEPTGWKLLCAVPDISEKIDGTELDLVKASSVMRQEEHATTVLFVLKVGPDAYKDTTKFPAGAWCKAGDFVLVRTYSGTRFKIFGKEFRLINDDQVDAVVQDPRGLTRA
jgi:co-chaperonin GroES (HSP10)